MGCLKVLLGLMIGAALAVSTARRLPDIIAKSGDSAQSGSQLAGTVGVTLLIAALSLWLIKSGLTGGRRRDRRGVRNADGPARHAPGRDEGDEIEPRGHRRL